MSFLKTRLWNELSEIFYELTKYLTIENLEAFILAILQVYEGKQVER